MLKRLFDYIAHMLVSQRVIYIFTRLTIGDKVALSQYLQLVRNRRFRHTEQIGNVTNAHGLALNGEEYAYSGRVAEDLKEVGEVIKGVLVWHRSPLLLYNITVQLLTFAGGGVFFIKPHFSYLIGFTVEWLFNCLLHYITPKSVCQYSFNKLL